MILTRLRNENEELMLMLEFNITSLITTLNLSSFRYEIIYNIRLIVFLKCHFFNYTINLIVINSIIIHDRYALLNDLNEQIYHGILFNYALHHCGNNVEVTAI